MKVVIIEDERPAYKRLEKLLTELLPQVTISAYLDSIEQAQQWFRTHDAPDLVFLDIHIADGNAFDLLQTTSINCPIIFTTAYENYAIEAFKTSSIDYLLKPLKKEDLLRALEKLNSLKSIFKTSKEEAAPQASQKYKTRFLIRFGEHIKTLSIDEIAYFYSGNKATFAKTIDAQSFPIDQNLDALELVLNPQDYFRINRQYIISLRSIEDMRTYTKARVVIKLNPPVKEAPVVSSERAADFKLWLAGEL